MIAVTLDTGALIAMAFAAIFGGALVYTSDMGDLARIGSHFPEVRLLAA